MRGRSVQNRRVSSVLPICFFHFPLPSFPSDPCIYPFPTIVGMLTHGGRKASPQPWDCLPTRVGIHQTHGPHATNKGREKKKSLDSSKGTKAFFIVKATLSDAYQMETRFSCGRNIGSPSFTLKASYQAPICGNAPFTRHSPKECTSLFVRFSTSSGRMLFAHTPA